MAFAAAETGGLILKVAVLTTSEDAAGVDDPLLCQHGLAPLAAVFLGFATSYYLWPITRAFHDAAGQPVSSLS